MSKNHKYPIVRDSLEKSCLKLERFFQFAKNVSLKPYKQIFLIILLLSIQTSFSKEEQGEPSNTVETATEAGAVCMDESCPPAETVFKSLKNTIDDQMCASMKAKPECQGVDENHIKGCVDFSGISNKFAATGKGIAQCGLGLLQGVTHSMTSLNQIAMALLKDDEASLEDPGLKSYLHAEFENASQDSGTTMAALETMDSIFRLAFTSMSEVYSCLNPLGVNQRVCQMITSLLFTGVGVPAYALAVGGFKIISEITGLRDGEKAPDAFSRTLAVPALLTTYIGVGYIGAAVFMKGPMALFGSATVSGVLGSMVTHDENVRERVKENMKTRIKELKEQEETKK